MEDKEYAVKNVSYISSPQVATEQRIQEIAIQTSEDVNRKEQVIESISIQAKKVENVAQNTISSVNIVAQRVGKNKVFYL